MRVYRMQDGHFGPLKRTSPLPTPPCDRITKYVRPGQGDELSILLRLGRHANIVRLHADDSTPRAIVLEACRMDLEAMFKLWHHPDFDFSRFLYGILRALCHIHAMGVAHLDVKPSNMLLGFDGEWKLCDFGSARVVTDIQSGRCTPLPCYTGPYAAPDVVFAVDHAADVDGFGADVYSFGVVVLHVMCSSSQHRAYLLRALTGNMCLMAKEEQRCVSAAEFDCAASALENIRITEPRLYRCMYSLLHFDPNERIMVEDMLRYLSSSY